MVGWTFAHTRTNGKRSPEVGRRAADEAPAALPSLGTVAVAGATGRTGQLVVQELLRSGQVEQVVAIARNSTKVAEVFPDKDPKLQTLVWDFNSTLEGGSVDAAEAMIWCAEGQSGLMKLTSKLASLGKRKDGEPRLVMCSTASLTRPTWNKDKQRRFNGAADIPIVRLNPGDILGAKRQTEDMVRSSGVPYTIVRPTGLNDKWPAGRPVLSQGDFAVGRTSRADLASLLTQMLFEPESVGKTFEAVSVAGYPKPANGYGQVLSRLRPDVRPGLPRLIQKVSTWLRPSRQAAAAAADEATYGIMQQLLPGEEQDSAALAMGQTYEQYDKGEEGDLVLVAKRGCQKELRAEVAIDFVPRATQADVVQDANNAM
eukprot:CAMPEP_0178427502 /NCGR_PEP_ID=MMETSP0689_2-20121128/29781_1 /TAXON_ID=160604 /ORGANISM="Amphidinium massartii, Strain CS-259" /LENGTH=371 /DNA_ID=CAMNT_0020049217 /DNA_START=150 /DNA_END=1266 /DNA_ORIENTATION=-